MAWWLGLSSLSEQGGGATRRDEGGLRHAKIDEGESPREDWPTTRPLGQLLYANKYDTGVLQNHR